MKIFIKKIKVSLLDKIYSDLIPIIYFIFNKLTGIKICFTHMNKQILVNEAAY